MVEAQTTLLPPEAIETSLPSRRPLPEIYRPHAGILHLSDCGERVAVDDQFVISFQYLTLRQNTFPTENLVVAKRRGLYIVFPKTPHETYDPPVIQDPDEIATMFVSFKPRRNLFYVGERYEVGFLPEDDRQPGDPIDILISSEQAITPTVLSGNETDYDFLKAQTQVG